MSKKVKIITLATILTALVVTVFTVGKLTAKENVQDIHEEKTDIEEGDNAVSLNEILGEDSNEDSVNEDLQIIEEFSLSGVNLVIEEDRADEIRQQEEIASLANYKIDILSSDVIAVEEQESDVGIKYVLCDRNELRYTVVSVTNTNEDELELIIDNDVKSFIQEIPIDNGVIYRIYTTGDDELDIRVTNTKTKSHYLELLKEQEIKGITSSNGQVNYGDIVSIGDNKFVLKGIEEVESGWIEATEQSNSVAYRKYRLTLQNITKGAVRVLDETQINSFKALNNKGEQYEIDTSLMGKGVCAKIKFSLTVGAEDDKLITKYTLDNEEYVDISVEVEIPNGLEVSRTTLMQANTLIKETAHRMFISYKSNDNYWVVSGIR